MRVIDFYSVGKEQSLLSQIALNLGAERSLPRSGHHDVENHGGRGDDD